MPDRFVKIRHRPKLHDARMVIALSGWMDGGDTSTGTIDYLVQTLEAQEVAEIDPGEFYIYNFPGSMEISTLFRPHTKIEDGVIDVYEEPSNTFFCCEKHNLVLFSGKEPNLHWKEYAECILFLAAQFNVTMIYFVGSVAGLVPHTREPRFHGSVSDERLTPFLQQHGLRLTNYEGPASIVTYLMVLAKQQGLDMATIVAEIPAYLQGKNVKCVEAAVKKIAGILDVPIDTEELKTMSEEFETSLNEVLEDRDELAEHIRKMEDDYDEEVFDTEMGDLKAWFEKQGIRLD